MGVLKRMNTWAERRLAEKKEREAQAPKRMGPARVKLVPKMSVRVKRAGSDEFVSLEELRKKEGW